MRYLDPRFPILVGFMVANEPASNVHRIARETAEAVAKASGYTFDEALRKIGIELPAPAPIDPVPDALSVQSPTAEQPVPNNLTEQISAALAADPSRSNRAIARACKTSATTVGKIRAAMGLTAATRTVTRRGKAYAMAVRETR